MHLMTYIMFSEIELLAAIFTVQYTVYIQYTVQIIS